MKRYFLEVSAPEAGDLEAPLWSADQAFASPDPSIVLEQYKLYVEMADRVAARRGLANTFFLTLNTLVFTGIGVMWQDPPQTSAWLGLFPLLVLVVQCTVWFWTIRSYRQLSAAKWAVVGAIERRLPMSPWWRAEWRALGEGKDPARYWPLTHVEQWIPWVFALAYVGGFATLIIARP